MTLQAWSELFVAAAGASAGLTGLIIVAMSVNIATIVSIPAMPSRAAATIAALMVVVVVSIAGLIPRLSDAAFGLIALVSALIALAFSIQSVSRIFADRSPGTPRGGRLAKSLVLIVPPLLVAIGGALATAGIDGGLDVVAAGFLLAFVGSVVNAWVLLVEIRR